jgi:hypothetical protein
MEQQTRTDISAGKAGQREAAAVEKRVSSEFEKWTTV